MGKNRGFQAQGQAVAPVRMVMHQGSNMAERISERKKQGKSWEEFKTILKEKDANDADNVLAMETEQFKYNLQRNRDNKRREQELIDLNKLREASGKSKLKSLKSVKKKDKKEKKKKDKKTKKKKDKKEKKKKKKKKKADSSDSDSDSDMSLESSSSTDTDERRLNDARSNVHGYKISRFLHAAEDK